MSTPVPANPVPHDADAQLASAALGATAPGAPGAGRPVLAARVRGLGKRFGRPGAGEVVALDQVSLDIPRGEFTAIMGPSGSGKSTLMHCIAGLDRPTSGSVVLAGREITGLDDNELTVLRRREIGFVFQAFNLIPTLSAIENVLLPIALDGRRPTTEEQQWTQDLLTALGLRERADHLPGQLSGGQQQRVAIARALITRPNLVIADEPTGNLDTRTAAEVLRLLREAANRYGQTIVMVTHDAHAASIADRVVFLTDGRLWREERGLDAAAVSGIMLQATEHAVAR